MMAVDLILLLWRTMVFLEDNCGLLQLQSYDGFIVSIINPATIG